MSGGDSNDVCLVHSVGGDETGLAPFVTSYTVTTYLRSSAPQRTDPRNVLGSAESRVGTAPVELLLESSTQPTTKHAQPRRVAAAKRSMRRPGVAEEATQRQRRNDPSESAYPPS